MKKISMYSLFALVGALMFVQIPSAEARPHGRTRTNVQVNVGNSYNAPRPYVVQRVVTPVYAQPVQYYNAPQPLPQAQPLPQPGVVYAYPQTTYVEQVYVAPQPRPFALSGLSFSWNFFK